MDDKKFLSDLYLFINGKKKDIEDFNLFEKKLLSNEGRKALGLHLLLKEDLDKYPGILSPDKLSHDKKIKYLMNLTKSASICLKDEKYIEAKSILTLCYDIDNKDLDTLFMLGEVSESFNDYKSAIYYFEKALIQRPKSIVVLDNLGWSYFKTNNFEKAQEIFRAALKLDPNHSTILFKLGFICFYVEDYEQSEKLLDKANRVDPGDIMIMHQLGQACLKIKKFRKAKKYLEKAIEIKPDIPKLLPPLALAYLYNGKFKKAEKILNTIIRELPEDPAYYAHLGLVMIETNRVDAGIDLFKKASSLDPDNPLLHSLFATCYWDISDIKSAKYHIKKAVKLDTNHEYGFIKKNHDIIFGIREGALIRFYLTAA